MSLPNQKPIAKYVTDFLDYCEIEKGLSANTQRNYKQYLNLFVRWLKETNNLPLLPGELSPEHIWDYRLFIARKYKTPRGSYLTKKSQNYYLIALRVLLDFFAERDIDCISSAKIKLAKHIGYIYLNMIIATLLEVQFISLFIINDY